MKLTAALSKLKSLKSQLARVDGYVTSSVVFYEGDEPEHAYLAEVETRRGLVNEIRNLKVRLMNTNAATLIDVGDKKTSLNDLILLNAELRSELAHWTRLLGIKADTESHFQQRTKDSVKKVFAEGYNKQEIKARINQLEATKEKIDALVQQANSETDLVG